MLKMTRSGDQICKERSIYYHPSRHFLWIILF